MLRLFLDGLLDLLWPSRTACLLCEGPLAEAEGDGPPVCMTCWETMPFAPAENRCTNCSRPLSGGRGVCVQCASPPAFGRVWAIGLHHGALREAVHHLKFSGRKTLAAPLGRRLARMMPREHDLIVPLPLHPSRLRERGYNQATLIACGLAGILGLPVVEGELVRLRRTGHQAKLEREERLRNLRGAFGTRSQTDPPWSGRAVLLVDDVLTTGATASAAAEAITKTGARRVDLAVLAVSDKHVAAQGYSGVSSSCSGGSPGPRASTACRSSAGRET